MNSDLQDILAWSLKNGLKLNVKKCSVLHVVPQDVLQALSQCGVSVSLDGQALDVVDTAKILGVVLDSGLTFSQHVTHTIQKALGRLRGLYRYRSLLPEPAKLQLIQSLILSNFYYCYPAYGNSISRGDKDRMQKMQNSAIRFVYGLKKFDHVSPYAEAANIPPLESVCRMLTCCMVHKTLMLKEPEYLHERLLSREEVALRSTRHGGRLHFPRVRLEAGRKSLILLRAFIVQ